MATSVETAKSAPSGSTSSVEIDVFRREGEDAGASPSQRKTSISTEDVNPDGADLAVSTEVAIRDGGLDQRGALPDMLKTSSGREI